ncbi:MAG: formylglycine-generating enzyme family protein [SAR324 cluster bacterium]|nr:formylglycine-generating enzyme family protein [SAR324 cluster bacterium]
MKTQPSNALRHLIRTSKRTLLLSVIALLGIVVLAWGATRTFSKLAQEFREETVKEFVGYVVKGERYPMVHAIYELRYRLFQSKLGINNKSETKACSRRRAFGAEVPEDQLDFCRRYDEFVDLAKQQIILPKVFEHLYYETEPFLIREIERRKARDAIRVWIRQKLRCLKDKYRCGRDERGLLVRVTSLDPELLKLYHYLLASLEKKLFPEEATLPDDFVDDMESKCTLPPKGSAQEVVNGMVYVSEGPFRMGSDSGEADERPVRNVLVKGFWIDRCEVTNYDFLKMAAAEPILRKSTFPRKFHDGRYLAHWEDDLQPPFGLELQPVTRVSWFAARYFCNALGKRLPSEAEWEKAARAGDEKAYSFGDDPEFLMDYGWYRKNATGTRPVSELMPSPLELFDIHGNAREWVWDWYAAYHPKPDPDPLGPQRGKYRVLRGGSWKDAPEQLRSASRDDASPVQTAADIGFRCASDQRPE